MQKQLDDLMHINYVQVCISRIECGWFKAIRRWIRQVAPIFAGIVKLILAVDYLRVNEFTFFFVPSSLQFAACMCIVQRIAVAGKLI